MQCSVGFGSTVGGGRVKEALAGVRAREPAGLVEGDQEELTELTPASISSAVLVSVGCNLPTWHNSHLLPCIQPSQASMSPPS